MEYTQSNPDTTNPNSGSQDVNITQGGIPSNQYQLPASFSPNVGYGATNAYGASNTPQTQGHPFTRAPSNALPQGQHGGYPGPSQQPPAMGFGPGATSAPASTGGMMTAPTHSATRATKTGPKEPKRRARQIMSCLECRKRKLRCDKRQPCEKCQKAGKVCVFLGPNVDEHIQAKLTEHKNRVGDIENIFQDEISKAVSGGYRDNLQFSSMVSTDMTYDESMDGDAPDIGSRIARLRITERIGGVGRPRIDEEIAAGLGVQPRGYTEEELLSKYQRLRVAKQGKKDEDFLSAKAAGLVTIPEEVQNRQDAYLDHLRASEAALRKAALVDDQNEDMEGTQDNDKQIATDPPANPSVMYPASVDHMLPTESYLPPGPLMLSFLDDVSSAAVPDLFLSIPRERCCNALFLRYWEAVHPIAACVNRSSLEMIYCRFWEEFNAGREPPPFIQALVLAALFSAAVSHEKEGFEEMTLSDDGKKVTVLKLQSLTECALAKANILKTTRFASLQAFVMYLVPLCRDEISRSHLNLVAMAVRTGELMGLHRDGQAFGLTPLETQSRRLVWHQLCFLDMRTAEAQAPRLLIRSDEYDTELPVHCNDDVWGSSEKIPAPTQAWVSTTLTIIRFEINAFMQELWVERRKLESRKQNLVAVVVKVKRFHNALFQKYGPCFDDAVPVQSFAKKIMTLLGARLYVMLLHPYYANTAKPLPDRLREVVVRSGLTIAELGQELATAERYKPWSWYLGTFHQFQVALLLATELYYRPDHPLADRIWPCLDYVFMIDQDIPRPTKAMMILTQVMERMSLYRQIRGVKAPASTAKSIPSARPAPMAPVPTPPPVSGPRTGAQPVHQGSAVPTTTVAATAPTAMMSVTGPQQQRHPLPQQQSHDQDQQQQQHHHQPAMPQHQYSVRQPQVRTLSQHHHLAQHQQGSMMPQQHQSTPAHHQHIPQMPQMPQMPPPASGPPLVYAGVADGQALWGRPQQVSGLGLSGPGMNQQGMAGSSGSDGSGTFSQGPDFGNTAALNNMFPNDARTGMMAPFGLGA